MALLDKLGYKQILNSGLSQKRTASDAQIDRVLKYATKLLPKLELKARSLTPKDVSVVYQFGPYSLFHVRAYPRKQPNTFLIVVTDEKDKPTDHILFDIAAEYAEQQLDSPQFGLFKSATQEDIRHVITGIDSKTTHLQSDNNGDVVFLDPKDSYSVWLFHHDGADVERLADSFQEWLEMAEPVEFEDDEDDDDEEAESEED